MLIHVDDTLPVLTGQIRVGGQPFDLSPGTTSVALKLVGPGDVVVNGAAVKAAGTQGNVSYTWQSGDTETAGVYYGSWIVTTAAGVFTQPGIDVVIYDPDVLWANSAAVEAIIGPQADVEPVIGALVQAQQAIESWVTREIPDPVPDRVRRAHAIMAARVVTGPQFAAGGSTGVIQESVGDHSVRYARPQEAAAVLDPSMHPEVVKLLKPWAPSNYTTFTSDEGGGTGASRSAEERLPASQVDYTSSQTVLSALDDLYTQVGQPGVTDHGALTGLADDDHLQYQRAKPVFTTSDPFTITDESFVVTTGAAVTMPDAASNTGRNVTIGSAAQEVTISAAGTDTLAGLGVVAGTYTFPFGSRVTFTAANIGGNWLWVVSNREGPDASLPIWYGQGIADGNLVTLQSGVPAWTTGTRTAEQFLSGTGWTDDVPVLIPVKNTTASTIAKGAPVYATGTVGATSVVEIAPADCDDASKMPAIGLTNSELIANATGYVTVVGTVRGVNTNAYSVNQTLYVSTTAGQLTGTKPTGTSELVQGIGRVTRVNTNSGEILVLGAGRTNDVPNAIDAGKLASGTVATARLGTGTASAGTFLRGDQTYARPVVQAYYVTGRYYYTPGVTGGGTRSVASGGATATPYPIYQTVSVDGLQVDLTSATGASQSIDLHVMSANASGDPDASVFTVNVSTTGTGNQVLSATGTPVSLSPGLYYVVAHNRSANAVTARSATAGCNIAPIPSSTATSANQFSGWLKTPGTGAITNYPAVTSPTDAVNQSPLVAVRFA